MTQTAIAICARASAPPAHPIALAFFHKKHRGYELAWPCIYCGAPGHRHPKIGLQLSACGRGMYTVRSNGGRIVT
jgi:hypothetical protein